MTIREYIKNDLIWRIVHQQELPSPITLNSIAKEYNVSLHPARQAVNDLIEERFLNKSSTSRLSINDIKRNKTIKQKIKRPKKINIEKTIQSDLLKLSFKGKVQYIREEAMAERYQIGRTVLRRIFMSLSAKGLLQHIERKGWELRPFNKKDFQDYTEIRLLLEKKALDLAWPKLNLEKIRFFLTQNRLPTKNDSNIYINNDLHQYWIDTSDNFYIKKFFKQYGIYFQLLSEYEEKNQSTFKNVCKHHREILNAILNNDKAKAKKVLETHILHDEDFLYQL